MTCLQFLCHIQQITTPPCMLLLIHVQVKESDQGRYSRVLKTNDQLYEIKSKWEVDSECSFVLCREVSLPVTKVPIHTSSKDPPKLRGQLIVE